MYTTHKQPNKAYSASVSTEWVSSTYRCVYVCVCVCGEMNMSKCVKRFMQHGCRESSIVTAILAHADPGEVLLLKVMEQRYSSSHHPGMCTAILG